MSVVHGCVARYLAFTSLKMFTIELAANTVTEPLSLELAHVGTVVDVAIFFFAVVVGSPTATLDVVAIVLVVRATSEEVVVLCVDVEPQDVTTTSKSASRYRRISSG
jgi:hypothetical protein